VDIDLVSRLKSAPGIGDKAGSISWVERPTKAQMPGITIRRLDPGRSYTFSGAVSLQDTRTRFDFWGFSVRDIKPLFFSTLSLLETGGSVGNTIFRPSKLEFESDQLAELIPELGKVFRVTADFRIWWKPIA
jgi:hypothetical protein